MGKRHYDRRELTITFIIDGYMGSVPDEEFAAEFENSLRNWDEGRYGLNTEMIMRGVEGVAEHALHRMVMKRINNDPKNAGMVTSKDGLVRINKALLMAERECRDFAIGAIPPEGEMGQGVTIRTISSSSDDAPEWEDI